MSFDQTPFFTDWIAWVEENDGEYFDGPRGEYNFYFGAHPQDCRITLSFDGANTVTLTHILVPESRRRSGVGTKFMNALCACADKHDITLNLISDETDDAIDDDEQGESDYDEGEHWLQNWYMTFGFDYTGYSSDYGPWMERQPQ
jgi:GNAT superfamily N-acetyltransferase